MLRFNIPLRSEAEDGSTARYAAVGITVSIRHSTPYTAAITQHSRLFSQLYVEQLSLQFRRAYRQCVTSNESQYGTLTAK